MLAILKATPHQVLPYVLTICEKIEPLFSAICLQHFSDCQTFNYQSWCLGILCLWIYVVERREYIQSIFYWRIKQECFDIDPLDKFKTNTFTHRNEIHYWVQVGCTAMHVFLFCSTLGRLCCQAIFFLAVSLSFSVYLLWGDFPYQYHSSSNVWKEAKRMVTLLFSQLLT